MCVDYFVSRWQPDASQDSRHCSLLDTFWLIRFRMSQVAPQSFSQNWDYRSTQLSTLQGTQRLGRQRLTCLPLSVGVQQRDAGSISVYVSVDGSLNPVQLTIVSLLQRASRSPALMTIVSGIGVARTQVFFGDLTSNPPTLSWNSKVMLP